MTRYGEKLSGVDEEQLCEQLRTESDPKEIKPSLIVTVERVGSKRRDAPLIA